MNIVNLTPHIINIYSADGERLLMSVEPSGTVARCAQTDTVVNGVIFQNGDKLVSIPVVESQFGSVEGLPEMNPLAIKQRAYIVSRMVKDAVPGRDDVFSPGPAIRDEDGRIVGCRGLSI